MKRTGLLLIAGAVAAVGILGLMAAAPAPSPQSSEIEQLKNEVAALRQRVDALEEHVKEGLIPAATGDSPAQPGVINPYQNFRPLPRTWKKGEFNGIPYYIVPIDKKHMPASEANKQAPSNETPAASETTDNR
jgi:hypothetical protein